MNSTPLKLCSCFHGSPLFCPSGSATSHILSLESPSLCSENVFLHPFDTLFIPSYASLVAQRLKCLPPMQETHIGSLGKEDPLEKEMATHSSILAWEIPWMEELGRLQSTGSQRVGHN